MKHILILILGLFLLLIAGNVTADSVPNLTGTWTLEKIEYLQYSGEIIEDVSNESAWTISQQGRIIQGINQFPGKNGLVEEKIAGVISPDGTTAHVVDMNGDLYIVYITDDDTLTINYLNTGVMKEDAGYAWTLTEIMRKKA
ncbi:hypothetical protein [Methanospirillum sp.]